MGERRVETCFEILPSLHGEGMTEAQRKLEYPSQKITASLISNITHYQGSAVLYTEYI
jgi:hypothetical protein